MIVLNKPAGTAVHPSPGHYTDTMANYVAGHLASRGTPSACRIIGRLDRETSGVIVFALNKAAAARLARQRDEGIFRRTYYAVAEGLFEEKSGTVDAPIAKIPGVLLKRRVVFDGTGDSAVTHYRVIAEDSAAARSLLEVTIDTGRTHQIRVHMAYLGHPLAGDAIYGLQAPPPKAERPASEMPHWEKRVLAKEVLAGEASAGANGGTDGPRALLHAGRLRLRQPFTGEELDFSAALPEDFAAAFPAAADVIAAVTGAGARHC